MKLLPVSGGKYFTKVDDSLSELLSGFSWWAAIRKNGIYVQTKIKGHDILLHRLILGIINHGKAVEGDHINGDTLDNQRSNLRVVTHVQNSLNSKCHSISGFKGVRYYTKRAGTKLWEARCGKHKAHIGYFYTAEEAARAYDKKAKMLYGEYARLNFPNEVL